MLTIKIRRPVNSKAILVIGRGLGRASRLTVNIEINLGNTDSTRVTREIICFSHYFNLTTDSCTTTWRGDLLKGCRLVTSRSWLWSRRGRHRRWCHADTRMGHIRVRSMLAIHAVSTDTVGIINTSRDLSIHISSGSQMIRMTNDLNELTLASLTLDMVHGNLSTS